MSSTINLAIRLDFNRDLTEDEIQDIVSEIDWNFEYSDNKNNIVLEDSSISGILDEWIQTY